MPAKARKTQQIWDGIGLFDLEADILIAVRGADPQSVSEIRSISMKEGGTICPVLITLAPKGKAKK